MSLKNTARKTSRGVENTPPPPMWIRVNDHSIAVKFSKLNQFDLNEDLLSLIGRMRSAVHVF